MEGASTTEESSKTALEAIKRWRGSMQHAVEERAKADRVRANALLSVYDDTSFKNDTHRKASADIKSADAERRAALAEAEARADGALVDLYVGRARQ